MNLKTKTQELLAQKEADIVELDIKYNILKSKQKIERNLSEAIFSLGKINVDKQIAETQATTQATRQFTTDLKVLLNWA